MTYVVNRIKYLMGEAEILRLSPWGIVESKTQGGSFSNELSYYDILGVSTLDYLDLYKKYTYSRQESYRLDYILV